MRYDVYNPFIDRETTSLKATSDPRPMRLRRIEIAAVKAIDNRGSVVLVSTCLLISEQNDNPKREGYLA